MKDLVCSPFEKPACETPAPSESTLAGQIGGYDNTDMPPAAANMSELPNSLTGPLAIKEAPGTWSTVEVAGGVTSPASPAANILKR